jgi:hypothetical protein
VTGKAKLDPGVVFKRTIAQMRAFGYVDRGWIKTAYGAFLDRQEKKKDEARKKTGFWSALGHVLASFVPGRAGHDRLPSERLMRGHEPASWHLLQAVLDHVPERGKRSHGGRISRRAKPLESVIADADKDDLKLVAKFLRASGLEETGFPVRLIGEDNERPKPGPRAGAESVSNITAKRGAALSALTGGLLYRFAYDYDGQLNWDDTQKIFRAEGIYRVYVCPPEQAYVEQRLILVRLEDGGAIVRAAEIRQGRAGYSVRGGYVIPASGVNTLILSSDFSTETIAEMVEELLGADQRALIFPDNAEPASLGSSFLQEHQLVFFTLLNRGGGEVRGSVLDGPVPAAAVGYRVSAAELGALEETRLGFLTLDDIERPRDRIMIASVGASPSVSIELG